MRKISKIKNYLFAFLIPLLICLIFLYFKGSLQSVENIFTSDIRCQHIAFFNYFKNVILGNSSIFYSFSAGLGNQMLAAVIFYCISPINILLFIIEDIQVAMLWIYIIRIALAGLTMYILLKSKSEKDSFMTVIFSTCYAFCSFVITYFYCIFWFDCLYLAPLVVLGIDKIFTKEKISLLYILSLALTIICNIQMGFGLCIFCVIYFFYSFNIRYSFKKDSHKFWHLGILFAVSSLCAGAISSGTLLGFMSSYSAIATTRTINFTTSAPIANLWYIIKNIFSVGHFTTEYNNRFEPLIYCGLIVTFFTILYFFNKDIDKRKRKHSLIVILIFCASFCVNILNLFWHLTPPISFNFRYVQYMSLFMVMLAYENYTKKTKLTKTDIIVLIVSLLAGLFIILGYNNMTYIIPTFIFLILLIPTIILAKNKNSKFEILLIILVLAEVGVSSYLSFYRSNDLQYARDTSYASFKEIANKNDFDDNYRIILNYSYTDNFNDTLLLNKNSTARYFSSVIYGKVLKFFEHTGSFYGLTNYTLSAYDTPIMVSLLGHKYLYLLDDFNNGIYNKLDKYSITSYDYMKGFDTTKDVYLYENPYALSLGYMVENDVKYDESMNNVDFQNAIIKAFSGIDKDVMIKLDTSIVDGIEHCYNRNEYPYCITYRIANPTNNKIIYTYSPFSVYTIETNGKGYLDINSPVTIRNMDSNLQIIFEHTEELDPNKFVASTYNMTNLIEALNKLHENSLTNVNIDKNILTAKIDANKDGKLFLSIPYDKNFKIYVDGKLTDYYPLLDDIFIGLDVTKGEHQIQLEYKDNNWKIYVLSSAISLFVTLILTFIINKRLTKQKPISPAEIIESDNQKVEKINKTTNKSKKHNKKKRR